MIALSVSLMFACVADNDPNFGADLYACVRRLLSELFILCRRCLGGTEAVENLIANRLVDWPTQLLYLT